MAMPGIELVQRLPRYSFRALPGAWRTRKEAHMAKAIMRLTYNVLRPRDMYGTAYSPPPPGKDGKVPFHLPHNAPLDMKILRFAPIRFRTGDGVTHEGYGAILRGPFTKEGEGIVVLHARIGQQDTAIVACESGEEFWAAFHRKKPRPGLAWNDCVDFDAPELPPLKFPGVR